MKKNNKIPGAPPIPKTEIDGKVINISSKTLVELLELRDRQQKLLDNSSFLSKLPDKGEKIKSFYDKIVKEIHLKHNEEKACELFRKINLNSNAENHRTVEHFEWNQNKPDTFLDSDDESDPEDVIQILSQSTSNKRITKLKNPQQSLITAEDILEIPHIHYIVDKTENSKGSMPTRQFKPYKTTTSDVHNPTKENSRKIKSNWEVTAATPPPIKHSPAKALSLEESLKLLQEQSMHVKEIEAKHAAERLSSRLDVNMTLLSDISKFGSYREPTSNISDDSDDASSDKEVHDDEPERGGVIYTVMS